MRISVTLSFLAAGLLATVPALAFPRMAEADIAIVPAQAVSSVPTADEWLGTWAETEPVPVDGRLGWNVSQLRLDDLRLRGVPADPELWLGDALVPGVIEEETVGDGVWFWFTPDIQLEADADYLFEFGDEGDMTLSFVTGPADLASVDAADDHSATLRTTWNPMRPGSDPSLITETTVSVDRTSPGSSRLSVIRIFGEDADGELVLREIRPVGIDRTVFSWWQDWPGAGSARPDEVCVTVVHEDGLGEQSDTLELCSEPTVNRGCSMAAVSPGGASGLAALLVPLVLGLRRRRTLR